MRLGDFPRIINGEVNTHNTRIWGIENPHELLQDFPKVTVLCAMPKKAAFKPFFVERVTVNGATSLDTEKESGNFIFPQDGASPPWSFMVRQVLKPALSDGWIGQSRQNDHDLMSWPPRSHTMRFPFMAICERIGLYIGPLFQEAYMS